MKQKSFRTIVDKLMIAICVIALIPILWIANYNHPSTDDYNFSDVYTWELAHSGGNAFELLEGSWKTMKGLYFGWQGTYSAFLLGPLHPGIYGEHEEYYKFTTAIILINVFLAMFLFFKELFKHLDIPWKKTIIITVPVFLCVIEGLPSPVQGLFWYTGSMTYLLFWAWMLWEAALLLSCSKISGMIKPWKWIVSLLLSFWIAGGNHVTAFANLLIALGFFVYFLVKKNKNSIFLGGMTLLSSTVGFLLNAFAPGTKFRAANLEKQGVIETITKSALMGVDENLWWVKGPHICLLLLIAILIFRYIVNDTNKEKFKFRYLFGMIILFYGLYCAMMCVPYYAMGGFGVGRMTNIRYATSILMWVTISVYFMGCVAKLCKDEKNNIFDNIAHTFPLKQKKWCGIVISLILMTFVTFFTGTVGGNVTMESVEELLSGEAQAYGRQCEESIGNDVSNPIAKPKMIYYSTHDPNIDS